jgi:excisionase family DNA binding protein
MTRHARLQRDAADFLTRQEVAELLGCSVDTVDRRIRSGKIKALVDDRLVRVARADLFAYVRGSQKWRR